MEVLQLRPMSTMIVTFRGNGEVIDLSDDSLPDVPEPHGDLDVLCN